MAGSEANSLISRGARAIVTLIYSVANRLAMVVSPLRLPWHRCWNRESCVDLKPENRTEITILTNSLESLKKLRNPPADNTIIFLTLSLCGKREAIMARPRHYQERLILG
jgi:hypothetical protein